MKAPEPRPQRKHQRSLHVSWHLSLLLVLLLLPNNFTSGSRASYELQLIGAQLHDVPDMTDDCERHSASSYGGTWLLKRLKAIVLNLGHSVQSFNHVCELYHGHTGLLDSHGAGNSHHQPFQPSASVDLLNNLTNVLKLQDNRVKDAKNTCTPRCQRFIMSLRHAHAKSLQALLQASSLKACSRFNLY